MEAMTQPTYADEIKKLAKAYRALAERYIWEASQSGDPTDRLGAELYSRCADDLGALLLRCQPKETI